MTSTKIDLSTLSDEEKAAILREMLGVWLGLEEPAKEAADPKPVDDPKTCVSMKADGTPCMAKPLKGNLVCRHHKVVEPDLPTKKAAARKAKAAPSTLDNALAMHSDEVTVTPKNRPAYKCLVPKAGTKVGLKAKGRKTDKPNAKSHTWIVAEAKDGSLYWDFVS